MINSRLPGPPFAKAGAGKTKNLIVAIALILLSHAAFAVETREEADFTFAKKALNDGFYDLAGQRLEAFLRNYPRSSHPYEAHALLGRCYYQQNNYPRALYEFEVVLNASEGSEFQDEALYWTGEIYLRNGDFKKALEFYQRIIDDFASSKYLSYAIYSKGWAYYKLGSFDDAAKCFREEGQLCCSEEWVTSKHLSRWVCSLP